MPGLYAAGETACTGVHGANRLASNSLLEGLVFGARAAEAMQQPAMGAALREGHGWKMAESVSSRGLTPDPKPVASDINPLEDTEAVRRLMWRSAGLFRTREQLSVAVNQLDRCYADMRATLDPAAASSEWKRFNLLTVARLIARAALRREESRGGHFREDFPTRDDLHWRVHLVDKIADAPEKR